MVTQSNDAFSRQLGLLSDQSNASAERLKYLTELLSDQVQELSASSKTASSDVDGAMAKLWEQSAAINSVAEDTVERVTAVGNILRDETRAMNENTAESTERLQSMSSILESRAQEMGKASDAVSEKVAAAVEIMQSKSSEVSGQAANAVNEIGVASEIMDFRSREVASASIGLPSF